MTRMQYVAVAIVMFLLGIVVLVDLFLLYAPFQAAVAVVAPFLVVTALFTVAFCALLMAAGAQTREMMEGDVGTGYEDPYRP